MSRGPGHVMRTAQAVILDRPIEYPWTYEKLASAIYDSASPTRSQLSSVARAARRLLEFGHVHIEPWVDDARGKLVRHEDPVAHTEQILLALPQDRGYSFEGLASRVYWRLSSWPTPSEVSATKRAVEQLVDIGRARVVDASEVPAGVPIVLGPVPAGTE